MAFEAINLPHAVFLEVINTGSAGQKYGVFLSIYILMFIEDREAAQRLQAAMRLLR